jgi:hypothetical protein
MNPKKAVWAVVALGWGASLFAVSSWSPWRSAQAEPPPSSGGILPDPVVPNAPGRTINPSDGSDRGRAAANAGGNTSGANNHAIALAGSIGSGESVVYYFDTDHQRLLVYQFKTGERGGIKLMAARHFDYDLKLEEYRDLSDKSRDELKAAYDAAFGKPPPSPDDYPVKKVESSAGK